MTRLEFENSSQSTTSSPRSHKLSVERDVSQPSQLGSSNANGRDLTPPSSVASSQEMYESVVDVPVTGKKRCANGEIKAKGHSRTISTLSQTSTGSMIELSESLKTKLSYALVKVQNGWQNHSLEEIESLASLSPRAAHASAEKQSLPSPRSVMATVHETQTLARLTSEFTAPVTEVTPLSRGLAPPATIVPGTRRRLVPNVQLQVSTDRPRRPPNQQRTPSQNAAMEADAVETLLFMSASPNSSGHFPRNLSTSPRKTQTSPMYSRPVQRYENKSDFIDRVLDGLDDDGREDLNEALSIMEAHKSAKLSA